MVKAELLGACRSECNKILIPLGGPERPDKLLNLYIIGRLDGHQNFITASEDAQSERATSGGNTQK